MKSLKYIITCILILFVSISGFSAKFKPRESQVLQLKSFFIDTLTINNPIIVDIDGIGYITSENVFNESHPKEILEWGLTCFIYGKCGTTEFSPFFRDDGYEIIALFTTNPDVFDELRARGLYNTIQPSFKFSTKKKGCRIYKYDKESICVVVFLTKIYTVNNYLNPDIEYRYTPKKKPKELLIKSKMPFIEYIRVAVPIEIQPKSETEK